MILEFFHRLTLISIQHFKKKLERMKFVTALKMLKETDCIEGDDDIEMAPLNSNEH